MISRSSTEQSKSSPKDTGSASARLEHAEACTDRRGADRREARGAEQRSVLVLGAFTPAEHHEHLQVEPGCGGIGEVALDQQHARLAVQRGGAATQDRDGLLVSPVV